MLELYVHFPDAPIERRMIAGEEANAGSPAWGIWLGGLAFVNQPIEQDADKFRRRVVVIR